MSDTCGNVCIKHSHCKRSRSIGSGFILSTKVKHCETSLLLILFKQAKENFSIVSKKAEIICGKSGHTILSLWFHRGDQSSCDFYFMFRPLITLPLSVDLQLPLLFLLPWIISMPSDCFHAFRVFVFLQPPGLFSFFKLRVRREDHCQWISPWQVESCFGN